MNTRSALLLFLSIFIISCNNELEVNADWKDVTVIYGALNPNQDTNFVRVQRGYLGKEPASNSYSRPDSLYYDEDEITVTLSWFIKEGQQRGELVGSAVLDAYSGIELNNMGPFTTEGYRVYLILEEIEQQYEYEIRVSKPGKPDTYASTRIVQEFDVIIPNPAANPPRFTGDLRWDNDASNISMYEAHYYFYYKDYDLTTKQSEIKVVEYEYPEVEHVPSARDYRLSTDNFFPYIANRIPSDPNKLRFFENLEFRIWGVDEELLTYMNLHAPAEGINQNRPDYTNVTNGIGIFGSRINIDVEGAILNEAGTPSFHDFLQTKSVMCDKRFASVRANGDTCICNPAPGFTDLKCPY